MLLRQRAGEFLVRVLFAKRLFAVEEYDSTGGYAGRAVRTTLVGGTKGAGEAFEGKRRVNGVRKRTLRKNIDALGTAFRTVWKTRDGLRKAGCRGFNGRENS